MLYDDNNVRLHEIKMYILRYLINSQKEWQEGIKWRAEKKAPSGE